MEVVVVVLLLQSALRAGFSATVTSAQAAAGTRPTIYWPFALRTDSQGVYPEHGRQTAETAAYE